MLEEYVSWRWGALGEAYFRLDGSTNRIAREMDMRSFNSAGSAALVYLISTRAGGQGINLATADVVVLYDTCYNPQVRGWLCFAPPFFPLRADARSGHLLSLLPH